MPRFQNPATIIILLAALQVLCSTYLLNIPNFYATNSILFLLGGIGISLGLLKSPCIRVHKTAIVNTQLPFKLLVVILLLPISYQLARHIMDSTPLQIEYADMLPIIKIMCGRFLNGHWSQVYQPVPEIWNGIQPIYLPALWLPFTPSLIFHFDLRWITVCGIWLSVILCILPLWKKNWQTIFWVAGLIILLTWLHFDKINNVIRLTEEGVVFFYYALLTIAIISRNPWLIGISAALCLLSRYALIGWIPFAACYLLVTKQSFFLLKTITAGSLVVLFILILPFGIGPLLYHFQLQHEYIRQAEKVWSENPEFYSQSLGMAKFFGLANIKLLHTVLVSGTFIIPLVFFYLLRKKISTQPNILLAGFQLSITFFYNFLDINYLYLYYTPVFVSLVIAGWSFMTGKMKSSTEFNTSQ